MSADDDISIPMSDHEHAVIGQLQDGVAVSEAGLEALFMDGIAAIAVDIEVVIDDENITVFPDLYSP